MDRKLIWNAISLMVNEVRLSRFSWDQFPQLYQLLFWCLKPLGCTSTACKCSIPQHRWTLLITVVTKRPLLAVWCVNHWRMSGVTRKGSLCVSNWPLFVMKFRAWSKMASVRITKIIPPRSYFIKVVRAHESWCSRWHMTCIPWPPPPPPTVGYTCNNLRTGAPVNFFIYWIAAQL